MKPETITSTRTSIREKKEGQRAGTQKEKIHRITKEQKGSSKSAWNPTTKDPNQTNPKEARKGYNNTRTKIITFWVKCTFHSLPCPSYCLSPVFNHNTNTQAMLLLRALHVLGAAHAGETAPAIVAKLRWIVYN
jgi:hypothetical protein